MAPRIEPVLADSRAHLLVTVITGLVLSAGAFVAFGGLLYLLFGFFLVPLGRAGSTWVPAFWIYALVYTGIVVLLMVAGVYYKPKENYYFGVRGGLHHFDDPTTFRDDADRLHAAVGFLLVAPHFIRLNLATLKDYLTRGRNAADPALAGTLLLLADEGEAPGKVFAVLPGLDESAAAAALDLLRSLHWIRFDPDRGKLALTARGLEVFREAEGGIASGQGEA